MQQLMQCGVWGTSVAAKATGTKDLWHFQEAAEGAVWLKWGLSKEKGSEGTQGQALSGLPGPYLEIDGKTWEALDQRCNMT